MLNGLSAWLNLRIGWIILHQVKQKRIRTNKTKKKNKNTYVDNEQISLPNNIEEKSRNIKNIREN